jgi:hypothetical protein
LPIAQISLAAKMPESKRAQRFGSCYSALIPQNSANGTATRVREQRRSP